MVFREGGIAQRKSSTREGGIFFYLRVKTLFYALLVVGALCSSAVAQESRVAGYYLNNPEKYEGKKITVNCVYVKRDEYQTGTDYVFFRAYTASRNEYKTGYITVRVQPADADRFAKKYGFDSEWDAAGNYRMRPLSGVFTKGDGTFFIDYTPAS